MAGKEITDTVPQLEAESYTACGHRGGQLGPGQAAVWLVGLEDGMHEPRVVGRQQPSAQHPQAPSTLVSHPMMVGRGGGSGNHGCAFLQW